MVDDKSEYWRGWLAAKSRVETSGGAAKWTATVPEGSEEFRLGYTDALAEFGDQDPKVACE